MREGCAPGGPGRRRHGWGFRGGGGPARVGVWGGGGDDRGPKRLTARAARPPARGPGPRPGGWVFRGGGGPAGLGVWGGGRNDRRPKRLTARAARPPARGTRPNPGSPFAPELRPMGPRPAPRGRPPPP